ncbi:MAG: hypothetical protein ACLFVB_06035 [Thermoplasmata archaeon]
MWKLNLMLLTVALVLGLREAMIFRRRKEGITSLFMIYIGVAISQLGFYLQNAFDYTYLSFLPIFFGLILVLVSAFIDDDEKIIKERMLDDYLSLEKKNKKESYLLRPKISSKFLKKYGPKRSSVILSTFLICFMILILLIYVMIESYPVIGLSPIEEVFMIIWSFFSIGIGALYFVELKSNMEWVLVRASDNEEQRHVF